MRALTLCVALSAVLTASGARAQSLRLTESEALARLSVDSPRVRAIRASIDVARAEALAAGRWPNPRLIYDRESVAGITEHMTMIGQSVPISGRRGLEVSAASTMADASTGRADEAVQRARADLRLAYAHLLTAQVRERELAGARSRLQQLVDVLAKREAAGDAAGFDRLRAQREVLEVDADRSLAAADRARAQGTLAGFFTGMGDPTRIAAEDAALPPTPIPPVDALVERAESTRGELLALRKEVESAEFAARAAGRRAVPEPEIVAGTKSSTVGGGHTGSVITLQAVMPVFDRGRPERALAIARASQARASIDAFRVALGAEIAGLRSAVVERREAAALFREAAVDSADQIERIAQVSYDAGERGILELLDAYRLGSLARIRQATLDAAAREAELELAFISGWEIPS